jgi:hypothetical protein
MQARVPPGEKYSHAFPFSSLQLSAEYSSTGLGELPDRESVTNEALVRATVAHNRTSQAAFGWASPYDLIHGPGESRLRRITHAVDGSEFQGGGDDLSSRLGRNDAENITQRDAKRPKERTRDKAYKQRFSMGSSVDMSGLPHTAFVSAPAGERGQVQQSFANARSPTSPAFPGLGWGTGSVQPPSVVTGRATSSSTPLGNFQISLTHSGTTVMHMVWDAMPISQLIHEAGSIFGLDPTEVVLILFSAQPRSLHRGARIVGPPPNPRVTPGSNIMVFQIPGSASIVAQPTGSNKHRVQSAGSVLS